MAYLISAWSADRRPVPTAVLPGGTVVTVPTCPSCCPTAGDNWAALSRCNGGALNPCGEECDCINNNTLFLRLDEAGEDESVYYSGTYNAAEEYWEGMDYDHTFCGWEGWDQAEESFVQVYFRQAVGTYPEDAAKWVAEVDGSEYHLWDDDENYYACASSLNFAVFYEEAEWPGVGGLALNSSYEYET